MTEPGVVQSDTECLVLGSVVDVVCREIMSDVDNMHRNFLARNFVTWKLHAQAPTTTN